MASKFINIVTGTDRPLQVGAGLSPCTKHIQYVPYTPESGSDGRIIFVDTPAIPDPEPKKGRSHQEEITRIENGIKEWLEKQYSGSKFASAGFPDNFFSIVLVANTFRSTGYSTCIKSTKIA